MKRIVFLSIFLITSQACAMGKKPLVDASLFKAEQLKLADKINGMENTIAEMKNELKANGTAIAGVNNKVNQVNQTVSSGRDTTQNSGNVNDTKLMREVLNTYKELTERYITLMKYIIGTLFASTASAVASLISAVIGFVWFLLKKDTKSDEFLQKLINKKED